MLLRWWRYLWGKRDEVAALDGKDAELARIVLRIHRHRRGIDWRFVPMAAIAPIHPINRPTALASAEERAARIRPIADALRAEARIGRDRLQAVLPSVSAIKLVEIAPGRFVSFEGNGRLAALRSVFTDAAALEIECELYDIAHATRLLRRIERLRLAHGFAADD
ncbi:MAG TPA: hypothetical protein PLB00_07765 [Pseudomonadota bacterium]|jgi:hypothetical protein|nr:hypothetical protein [Pseudomonadota bacterium]